MERMVDTRIPKQAFEYRTVGTRDHGRPWKKMVRDSVKSERAIVQVVQKKEKKYKVVAMKPDVSATRK